jgi:tRNA(fMet)-specific endonuclease VapC
MSSAPALGGHGIYLLDTSILVLSLRGDANIRARLAAASTLYLPSIAVGELYVGAYGSPTRAADAVHDVEALAVSMTVLTCDATTAQTYGSIKNDLKRRGVSMPDNDLWIAATALQYQVTLAARDAHFNWVTALSIEQW